MQKIKLLVVLLLIGPLLEAQEKPNIVYIICDDLGYGDVQIFNPKKGKILTPSIDALAQEGMMFTDAHSASAVCTPSRYAILTGRYAWRSKLQKGVLAGGVEVEPLIADSMATVPKLLKNAGYRTAAIGKWHLGFDYVDDSGKSYKIYEDKKMVGAPIGATVPNGPLTRGFDSFIGFHHSRDMQTVVKNDKVIDKMPPVQMLQFLGDHATEYIQVEAKKNAPFFMYLALNSPHSPVVPSKNWQGKSGMGAYADFVMETDYVVGRVLQALKDNGLEDNTLVFFTSDNGTSAPVSRAASLEKEHGHYPSAGYRGYKSDIWEGGHRIPFIAKWPGKIDKGSTNNQLICQTNLMATCAEIMGMNLEKSQGVDSYSILPLLKNRKAKTDYKMVVHHSINGKFSIRDKRWKLELTPGSGGWSEPKDAKALSSGLPEIQLYDMKNDREETTNVFEKYPEIVKRLTAELKRIVEKGRSTPGSEMTNDVPIDLYKNGQTTANH